MNIKLNYKTILILSLITTIIFTHIMTVGGFLHKNKYIFDATSYKGCIYIASIFENFFISCILFIISFAVIKSTYRMHTKILMLIPLLSFTVFVISFVVIKYQIPILMGPLHIRSIHNLLIINLIKNMIMAILILLTTVLMYTLQQQQLTLIENSKLSIENIHNRYEALKNQLNPHFLFNTLNTLDGLIGFDDDKAHEYIQQLSLTFRYVISNNDVVTVRDELNFVKSYNYLMKIRYGNNLSIQYDIAENYLSYHILPISLQLLVENAVKHNVISDRHQLSINIYTTNNNTIKVENNIRKIVGGKHEEGIGLISLSERYKLQFGKEVVVTNTDNIFTVEVPIIDNKYDTNNKLDKG